MSRKDIAILMGCLFMTIVFSVTIPWGWPGTALGLTDSEVQRLRIVSPEFAAAEDELRDIRSRLSRRDRERLEKSHAIWVRDHRDGEARSLMMAGHSFARAYTLVDKKRSAELRRYLGDNPGLESQAAGIPLSREWFVFLGSYPRSHRHKAELQQQDVRRHGLQARVIDTGLYRNLKKNMWAVVLGPFPSRRMAGEYLAGARAIVSDAFIKRSPPRQIMEEWPYQNAAIPGGRGIPDRNPPSKYDYGLNSVVVVRSSRNLGAGFFVSRRGLIVSNQHVVGEDQSVTVTLRSGREVGGVVVDMNPDLDLVLIKVPDASASYLDFADFNEGGIGAEVIAIGTPEGLSWSLSRGVVSGIRNLEGLRLIQTDAAINQGNSGGPLILVDSGRVIGVNTISFRKDIAEGISFAVSAHNVREAFWEYLYRPADENLSTGRVSGTFPYPYSPLNRVHRVSTLVTATFRSGDSIRILTDNGLFVQPNASDDAGQYLETAMDLSCPVRIYYEIRGDEYTVQKLVASELGTLSVEDGVCRWHIDIPPDLPIFLAEPDPDYQLKPYQIVTRINRCERTPETNSMVLYTEHQEFPRLILGAEYPSAQVRDVETMAEKAVESGEAVRFCFRAAPKVQPILFLAATAGYGRVRLERRP